MYRLRHILVATDFSPTSERAISHALDLGEANHAEVTVLHAYEVPLAGLPDGALLPTTEVVAKIAETSRAELDKLMSNAAGRDVTVRSVLREGTPHEVIEAVASEIDADLIVVGTHGRRGISRAILGSVAEKLIRTTSRPVLTLRG